MIHVRRTVSADLTMGKIKHITVLLGNILGTVACLYNVFDI